MYIEYPADTEVAHSKDDCWVALQEDATMQAVHVESCNASFLAIVSCLAIYDAGEGNDFVLCEAYLRGKCGALVIPEGIILFLQTLYEFIDGGFPVYFVGVGDEEGREGLLRMTE